VGASLYRETGLVLPLLLLAAEFTVLRDQAHLNRPLYLGFGLAAALVLAARSLVLAGDVVGTVPAEALAGSGLGGRALTMLGVVPHWLRLLLWPAALQTDYGPREIVAATGWGLAQWAGALIIGAWAAAVLAWRRRSPVLAFGLLWTAIALLPVSNVLVPTGITLAERTLLLSSVGAVLVAGAVFAALWSVQVSPVRLVRWPALAALTLLLVLGVLRSRSRSRVWSDQQTLLQQTVLDAPRSYAAHLALSRFLGDSGSRAAAEAHYRQAIALKPVLLDQERSMAEQYRLAGYCRPALRHYRGPLLLRPEDLAVRKAMVACLLELERYDEVGPIARIGAQDAAEGAFFREAIRIADSALAAPRRGR
jgi:tetratricopeptide (TPR) repeat protein